MAFNENTRVKIPAILHLCRLGYDYLSLSQAKWDESTNIFSDLFSESIVRINPDIEEIDMKRVYEDVSLALDNEDLGQAFYNMLIATAGIKLIDFKNFNNNSFHVVTELTYKNGDDEFRPDITLLVNGVKKPNNHEGILAERNRINVRFKNNKEKNYSLSAGQYFDVKIEYTDITPEEFEEKMEGYKQNLDKLFGESKDLEKEIKKQLAGVKDE